MQMNRKNCLIYKRITGFLFLTLPFLNISGQELIGLTENQEVKKAALEQHSREKTTSDAAHLELPFFEDFSTLKVYPDQSKWTGLSVFINSSFPDEPPSIGVATLDAIDATGEVYAINDHVTPSDTLTSLPFNLLPYKDAKAQVVLSFWCQAGGKGEMPDPKDSLVLEYFSPQSNEWTWIWDSSAASAGAFRQKIFTVPRSFYEDGFQFRFRNYTSMSINEVKGKYGALSNVDQWHLDYFMMDTMPRASHSAINDIAFVDPLTDLLYEYTTVPWNHLDYAGSIERNVVRYVVRNFHPYETANIERSYSVRNVLTHAVNNYEVLNGDIGPNSLWIRNDPFDHSFQYEPTPYGQFEVTAFIGTLASQFMGNDTVKYMQLFRDAYAYDDGTAEFGFGISGESTTGAMVACRFPIFREDTIRGIDIFFNKTRNNYTADLYFKLCIWKNKDGKPGDTLFVSEDEFSPDTGTGLLEFTRYRLPLSREIIVDDTVFIGIQQLQEDFLNIGYDVSHDNRRNIFVNITGSWYSVDSLDPSGSLMMRPVFSTQEHPSGIAREVSGPGVLTVYPNPVTDLLHIGIPEVLANEKGNLYIYDMTGRQTFSERLSPTVYVGDLNPGIYLVRLVMQSGQVLVSRFIVGRQF
jgi:Secretion system C-terminal sorting domain